ncbi:MAG TPA: ATP-dependent Clp protease adapter ClpS [Bacteriovoracaceae bacterium]|nr:ATP-dependent Clp protease adapter ClpS [Bacteriovoracaceae bacterium]
MSSETEKDEQSGTATIRKEKLQPPRKYKVIMHNDDYTTMEFVMLVLQKFFNKAMPEAQAIMLEVHTRGFGICGIFTYEVAESKVAKVIKYARDNGHPLKCSTEPCDS